MTNQHPITPPDQQLVRKWIEDWARGQMKGPVTEDQLVVATQAAQWGADMELEACVEWLDCRGPLHWGSNLRAARRPKPPSLKEQALKALTAIKSNFHVHEPDASIIRRALEALDD